MKSLIYKLARTESGKKIRNFFGFKPSYFNLDFSQNDLSISDAFFWTVDKNFHTVFRFSDILKLFYGSSSSSIEMFFYDNHFNLVKKFIKHEVNINEEIVINQKFLNGFQGYGTFYIFHKTSEKFKSIIRNSCYTGYSYKNSLPSFVHGNLYTAVKKNEKVFYGLISKSFFFNKIYRVQNYYNHGQTDIFLMNPCKSKIKIKLNDRKEFNLNRGCSRKLTLESNEDMIILRSNCYLLRPVIITLQNDFIDAHHG